MRTTKGKLFQRSAGGIYYLRYQVGGGRKTVCLHTKNKDKAETERDKTLGNALRADTTERVLFHVAENRKLLSRVSIPIDKAWAKYTASDSRPKSGKDTLANYERQWKRFSEWLAKKHADVGNLFDVDRKIALAYKSKLEADKLSPETFNQHVKTLRLVYRVLALDNEHGGVNPFEAVNLKPKATINREAFSKDEVTALLAVFDGPPELRIPEPVLDDKGNAIKDANGKEKTEDRIVVFNQDEWNEYRCLFNLGAYTGLRFGDACTLKWKTIDFDTGLITLTPRKTKRVGRTVKVPLHPALREQLRLAHAWRDKTTYVLPSLAADYLKSNRVMKNRVIDIIRSVGITTHGEAEGRQIQPILKGFHSLRHFFASYAASVNIPVNVLAELLGDNVATLQRYYVHGTLEAMSKAVASLTAAPKALPCPVRTADDRVTEALAFIQSHPRLTKADRASPLEILSAP